MKNLKILLLTVFAIGLFSTQSHALMCLTQQVKKTEAGWGEYIKSYFYCDDGYQDLVSVTTWAVIPLPYNWYKAINKKELTAMKELGLEPLGSKINLDWGPPSTKLFPLFKDQPDPFKVYLDSNLKDQVKRVCLVHLFNEKVAGFENPETVFDIRWICDGESEKTTFVNAVTSSEVNNFMAEGGYQQAFEFSQFNWKSKMRVFTQIEE